MTFSRSKIFFYPNFSFIKCLFCYLHSWIRFSGGGGLLWYCWSSFCVTLCFFLSNRPMWANCNICWRCFTNVQSRPHEYTPFQPKEKTNEGLSLSWWISWAGGQTQPFFTEGLRTAVIGVSHQHCGSRRSVSWTWWWNCHKKRDLSVYTTSETN